MLLKLRNCANNEAILDIIEINENLGHTAELSITIFTILQVRKSFFNDLNINNDISIVDLLYQQFYTGSDTNATEEEQEFMRKLFTSETYVKSELKYARITQRGNVEDSQLSNWTAYLEKYRDYIEKGFQFTRLAVQEPYGKLWENYPRDKLPSASNNLFKRHLLAKSTEFLPFW